MRLLTEGQYVIKDWVELNWHGLSVQDTKGGHDLVYSTVDLPEWWYCT